MTEAKNLGAPYDLVRWVAKSRPPAGAELLRGRHRHSRRRRAHDAARRRGGVRGLGHLQVERPGACGPRAIVQATTHYKDPDVLAKVSEELGDAMPGIETSKLEAGSCCRPEAGAARHGPADRRARAPGRLRAPPGPSTGAAWSRWRCGSPGSWTTWPASIIPGGESTTLLKLMDAWDFVPALEKFHASGRPIFGTCAGLILLAREVESPQSVLARVHRRDGGAQRLRPPAGVLRGGNGGGARREPVTRSRMVFIRAPRIRRIGPGVEVLARHARRARHGARGHGAGRDLPSRAHAGPGRPPLFLPDGGGASGGRLIPGCPSRHHRSPGLGWPSRATIQPRGGRACR